MMSNLASDRRLDWRSLVLAMIVILVPGVVQATPLDNGDMRAAVARGRDEPIDALIQNVEHAHPIAMFLLAKRLYDLDQRDEAVFLFYVGQLRWRACLAQYPNCGREPFSRLFETIGPDLNQHAFRDLAAYERMVASVLEWDENHHDDYVTDLAVKERVRHGPREEVEYARAHSDQLRARQEELARTEAIRGDDPYGGDGGAIGGMPQELLTAYDANRFAGFRRNVTTRAEVIAALGRPEWWSTDLNGSSTFGYSYLRVTDVSAVLGMAEQVHVRFNASEILLRVNLPQD
jgi:hypothetical protein